MFKMVALLPAWVLEWWQGEGPFHCPLPEPRTVPASVVLKLVFILGLFVIAVCLPELILWDLIIYLLDIFQALSIMYFISFDERKKK